MRKSTLRDRLRIVELGWTGCTDADIEQQVGWSRATVGKWRRRGQATDENALVSRMGRPKRGALSHFPAAPATQLLEWRLAHPRWGVTTLRAQAMQSAELQGLPILSRSTLARWLKQQQLVRRHRPAPSEPASASRPTPQAPHEVWELDAQGYQKVAGLGVVALIDLVDRFSRVKVLSYPCYLGAKRVECYPNQVEVTFEPEQRQLVFHDLQTQTVCRRPIKALTAQDLIGDLSPSMQLMPFQIPMPFLLEAKDILLLGTSSATTL